MIIKTDILRAAILFAGQKDFRGCFTVYHSVHVRHGRIESLNGHVMFFHKADIPEGIDIIIPRDAIEAIIKSKSGECELSTDGVLKSGDLEVRFAPMDYKYPDSSKVIPKKVSGEPAVFNPKYLDRCGKAAKILTGNPAFRMAYNGNGPAVIMFSDPDAFAIVMPMRDMASTDISSIGWRE